jgi:tRNA modification GTPase
MPKSMREPLATDHEDTIVAISTPPGEGGVGIVRLSGAHAIEIASKLFRSSIGRDPRQGGRIFHGHVVGAEERPIDEVLLHLMRSPRSYTREDVAEINGHGGPGPLNAILEEALHLGARLARPGEFTLRAFLNGRIDLVQAEAVIDQIRARTRDGLLAANAAAGGTLSKALYALRDRLANALAHIEAAVDFPEEDLPELVTPALFEDLRAVQNEMQRLIVTADAGRLYREGAALAIAGRPNVGKSSLFNALLRDARAIVSAQPGTTRDRLEEYITLRGVPVRLIDMAGLRATQDEIERIGVDMARDMLRAANLAIFVIDASAPDTEEDQQLAGELAALEIPVVVALNKIDLAPEAPAPVWADEFDATVQMSVLHGQGIPELEETLGALLLGGVNLGAGDAMLNRLHQKDSLRRAAEALDRLLADTTLSPEFLALELRDALQALGEITGETTPEDLLDTIFAAFCVGK